LGTGLHPIEQSLLGLFTTYSDAMNEYMETMAGRFLVENQK